MKRKSLLIVLILLFLIAAAAIFFPDYESPRMIGFLILSQVMFVLSLGIFLIGRKIDFENGNRRLFLIIVVLALIARAIMLVGAGDHFYLSDDVYRYIWDGKVTASGINPFLYEPRAPELESLRDDLIHPNINHPHLPTIYPPLAQNIFALSYLIGGHSLLVFKLICAIFELLTIMALLYWLKATGIARANILLYLFSPLILIEFYLSAHLDILALPFLVAALITLHQRRPGLTGLLLALASMVKFFGLFFVPFVFLHFRKKAAWLFTGSFALTTIALYLPYVIGSEGRFLGSLFDYLAEWQYNGSVFLIFKWIWNMETARYISGILFILWIIGLIIKNVETLKRFYLAMAGFIVLTPVFFPWYFVWIYPFVLRNLSPAFVYLSGATLLSYDVFIAFYDVGYWKEIWWLRLLIYLPFYLLLIIYAVKRTNTEVTGE